MGDKRRTIGNTRAGLLGLIVASAAFFAFAVPAMAAPPVFGPAPSSPQETEGPGGYELNLTATDDTDTNVGITCAPFDNGDTVPVGGPHAISCIATDDSADPAPDTTPLNFNLTVTDTVRSDLQIEKSSTVLKASPGQIVPYTFQVTNHGPSNATGVTVRDPLSQHLTFVAAGSDPACTVTSGELVCNFGNIANGATATKNGEPPAAPLPSLGRGAEPAPARRDQARAVRRAGTGRRLPRVLADLPRRIHGDRRLGADRRGPEPERQRRGSDRAPPLRPLGVERRQPAHLGLHSPEPHPEPGSGPPVRRLPPRHHFAQRRALARPELPAAGHRSPGDPRCRRTT